MFFLTHTSSCWHNFFFFTDWIHIILSKLFLIKNIQNISKETWPCIEPSSWYFFFSYLNINLLHQSGIFELQILFLFLQWIYIFLCFHQTLSADLLIISLFFWFIIVIYSQLSMVAYTVLKYFILFLQSAGEKQSKSVLLPFLFIHSYQRLVPHLRILNT